MDEQNRRRVRPGYMERRVKPGLLEVDYKNCALIINWEVEATVLGDHGELVQEDRKSHRKRIKLPNLNEHSNIAALAIQIVEKSKYIHESKLPRVEQLLSKLQQYVVEGRSSEGSGKRERRRKSKKRGDRERRSGRQENSREGRGSRDSRRREATAPAQPEASMDCLNDYMEKLYDEDMRTKVQGTSSILILVKDVKLMEELIQNDPLMSSLARVLKEDYKKSMDLVLDITTIFFYFSSFSQMHPLLMSKGVGAMNMKVVELELKRYKMRVGEMKKLEAEWKAKSADGGDSVERRDFMKREQKKTAIFVSKQEKVLHVCIHTLLNLAEDINIERKMVKKRVADMLVELLPRKNADLLTLTVVFLKKLSIFVCNKDRMRELDVVPKVIRLMSLKNDQLILHSLRLLFNLAMDTPLRGVMVNNGIIPRLVALLKRAPFRAVTLRLLYYLSIEDRCKSMFTYAEAMHLLVQLIVKFPKPRLPAELAALAINLSYNARNCEQMCSGKCLHFMMQRMCKYPQDPLLCAVLRNVSQWTYDVQQELALSQTHSASESKRSEGKPGYKQAGMWAHYIRPLLQIANKADQMPSGQDSLLQILGTLANLTSADMPKDETWATLAEKSKLLHLLRKLLVPSMCEEDVVQAAVMLIATISLDTSCDQLLASSELPRMLVEMLRSKFDDAGLLLQVLYALYRMLRLPQTGNQLLYHHNIVGNACACLGHSNPAAVTTTETLLNLAMDFDRLRGHATLWEEIREQRFELHNREWIEMIKEMDMDDGFVEEGKLYFDDGSGAGSRDSSDIRPVGESSDQWEGQE